MASKVKPHTVYKPNSLSFISLVIVTLSKATTNLGVWVYYIYYRCVHNFLAQSISGINKFHIPRSLARGCLAFGIWLPIGQSCYARLCNGSAGVWNEFWLSRLDERTLCSRGQQYYIVCETVRTQVLRKRRINLQWQIEEGVCVGYLYTSNSPQTRTPVHRTLR